MSKDICGSVVFSGREPEEKRSGIKRSGREPEQLKQA